MVVWECWWVPVHWPNPTRSEAEVLYCTFVRSPKSAQDWCQTLSWPNWSLKLQNNSMMGLSTLWKPSVTKEAFFLLKCRLLIEKLVCTFLPTYYVQMSPVLRGSQGNSTFLASRVHFMQLKGIQEQCLSCLCLRKTGTNNIWIMQPE